MVMSDSAVGLGPEFWSGPVVARALARCDFAVLMEEIRREHGWTQAELAEAAGYSQSWVSKVLRRKQALNLDQARELARRLGIPVHLLRLGEAGGDGPANRRDFGKSLALALVAWPGMAEAGENAAPALTMITSAQRRLDATTPARDLARGVAAHVEMANRMLTRARTSRRSEAVAAALSEAAGFAAWLHADMCDLGTARTYYRLAVDAARHAGHHLLAGYMLGSLAALEIDAGDAATGLGLTARAREQIGPAAHPTPRAWLAAIEALGHAASPAGGGAAERALGWAGEAAGDDAVLTPPPWPWLFPFDHAKLAGYRALVCVRLGRPGEALSAFAESLAAAQPAPKQRAVIMLEVATAASQEGAAGKDTARIDEAFRLAGEGLAAGMQYSSERAIQRSRTFRRGYTGPVTRQVRDFDQRLLATLP
jgi:transcriptional regulator with XRE-family HTH domain